MFRVQNAFVANLQLGAVGQCAFDSRAGQNADLAGHDRLGFPRRGAEGTRDGMTAADLHRGDFAEKLHPVSSGCDDKVDDPRVAFAQRPGLVENGGVDRGE